MKHLISFNYIHWLKQFSASSKHTTVKALVPKLVAGLKKSNSVEEVIALIEPHVDSARKGICGPINFYSQLANWHNILKVIVKDSKQANQALTEIQRTEQNRSLLELISQFLNNPRNQLHYNTPSLLKTICDNELPEIIEYIISLEKAPAPKNPQKGSFASIEPFNDMHAACLELLNNVSKKFEERNPLWHKANTLLQSSLLNYQEMREPESDLEDSEEFEEDLEEFEEEPSQSETMWSSMCHIM